MAANSNNSSFSLAGNDPFDLSWLFLSNDTNVDMNHVGSSSGSGLNNNDWSLDDGQLDPLLVSPTIALAMESLEFKRELGTKSHLGE
ncbi:hypothetical protein CCACVL1_12339 [Corchorus capsularis]|uniref:Uncharacterized protein n=1 Tax=Corchorus capsularis TaxID=210143 RepID=A0A1R3IGC1_COCAP|nr:hypothetical protein CCACVL1_12339 [Corchorus capsularis]